MFTEFVREYLGEEKYEKLKEVYRHITKYTVNDLTIKLEVLNEIYKADKN